MKKFFGILAIAIAVCFAQSVSSQKSATFNLKMNVSNYIEVMASPVDFNFGTTTHDGTYAHSQSLYGATGEWNLAYCNCPFSVTISGNNPANQNVPRFARQETGTHASGYDVLPTLYAINFTTNGVRDLFYGTWLQGANQFPYTKSYSEAPHNGQVKMDMVAYVNSAIASEAVPVLQTLINPAFTNAQSADAGDYTCTMVVTLAAL